MKANTLLLLALGFVISVSASAQHNHSAQIPYAGMQSRAIKSLSDSDIQELRRGGGWGLALPAELNGMPGPLHLLELKDQIPLATDQVPQIQVLVDEMRKAAIPAGEATGQCCIVVPLQKKFRKVTGTPPTTAWSLWL
jgi:hypothetical protein